MDRHLQDAARELKTSLQSDEKLIWTGIPRQGIQFGMADAFIIPFSVLWTGFSVFWQYNAFSMDGMGIILSIFGAPFLLLGLYLLVGRFFVDATRRKNTIYGITNHRVVIRSGILSKKLQSIELEDLQLTLIENENRTGTLLLTPEQQAFNLVRGSGLPGSSNQFMPALENISDARKVYMLLQDLQREAQVVNN